MSTRFFRLNQVCFAALATLSVGIAVSFNHPSPRPAFDPRESQWVDSVFQALTPAERIGQLFMIRAHSDKGPDYEQKVADLIQKYRVGGLCFFQGTPERQALLTNRYQALSDRVPLLISMDAEWGLGMRLREGTIAYPRQLMLGALTDNRLIYEMGRDIARQCRRLGVHLNFAPVIDVNNNPANPVINDRSFGEDRKNVAAKAFQYMMGLQDGGVMACAKHFPGHGDTDVDSHVDLPVLNHSMERLDSLELFPFRALILYGVASVMVAHLHVPTLDARKNRPTTLSRAAIMGLLRKKMGYEGLILTDAMEMEGVAKFFRPGQAEVEALQAGNDMILLPPNLEAAFHAVQTAILDGTLDARQLAESVRRVLRAKYRLGLVSPQRVDTANLRRDLNTPASLVLRRKLIEHAITLVRDRDGLAGMANLEHQRIAAVALGDTTPTPFQKMCLRYAPLALFNLPKNPDSSSATKLLDTLRTFDAVLIGLHGMTRRPEQNYGLTPAQIALVRSICHANPKTALFVFGNPYSLAHFDEIPTVVAAYSDDSTVQEVAAQAFFGAIDFQGVLPVTASAQARLKQGIQRHFPSKRLAYDLPEAVGLNSDTLRLLDTLATELIAAGAAPGCQVLVAKDGKVVWYKAYGHHTYEPSARPVALEDLYDLASITKVAATTLALMYEVDANRIHLDSPLLRYLPELEKTNKANLTLREILVHQAGLQAWIPFYQKTLTALGKPSSELYLPRPMTCYEIPVARELYLADDYRDTIWQHIFASPLREDRSYRYSDLGLYLCARIIERLEHQPLDVFVRRIFYRPMGLSTTVFNPWQLGLSDRCVPTEEDNYFRHQRLQGYVHDMGAAMLGGVSGHAGLFSNANDLAKLFQMLLNRGEYGGRRYLMPNTVALFTQRHLASTRRGLGFDMKELDPNKTPNMSLLASPHTFGHTGFTGTCAWADPEHRLIFIFLSNRTFPTMENNKLLNGNYRPRLQSVVYRALMRERTAN
ncbi:MAG: serine hydrolase [Saprospiraceae bacterium]|nr:serine hydrolase [Saprospiraceae bacterium]MDW8483351.1 glycoside hydrolase family 3 N-terminal domain-containing protein [Saprospiraceae bacterium]